MFTLKNKQNIIIPILLFLTVFGFYLYTSPRSQTGYADSEELMAAAYTLGVPHPPGYPLFPILAKPFTFIPYGSIAFRLSIFSSFFGAVTCVLIYLTILKIIGTSDKVQRTRDKRKKKEGLISCLLPHIAALVGAFSLAFSYTFWLYSIVPEVYCLSNFFEALILFVAVSWYQAKKENRAKYYPYLFIFVWGLAFLSQQILVFLIPVCLYFIWWVDRDIFFPSKRWLGAAGALILGLLPLIYLPLAALSEPELDYGNPTNLDRFWRHITRAIYRSGPELASAYLPAEFNIEERFYAFPKYFSFLINQFTPILIGLGLLGIFFLIRKRYRIVGGFIVLSFIFAGPLLAFYGSWGTGEALSYNSLGARERIAVMSYIVFSILIGVGIFYLLKLIKKLNLGSAVTLFVIFLFLLIPIYPLRDNFSVVNKRNFYLGHDFAENLFLNIEPNGILFTKGDRPTFTAQYYQLVEKKRLDVTVLSFGAKDWNVERWEKKEPDLFDTENKALLAIFRNVIQKNIDKRPIYITGLPRTTLIQMGIAGNPYVVSPRGIICQVTREFDFSEEYWDKLIWHGPENIESYYDWYAKELIEQYVIGLSNNYFHFRLRDYYDLTKEAYLEMQRIAPDHRMSKQVAANFEEFSKGEIIPKRFVLGTGKEHFEMARTYLSKKEPVEAMSEYWMAVFLEPDNNVYRLQLGGTYETLGWHREAYEQYLHILTTETENEKVIKKTEERIEIVKYKLGK